MLLDRAHALREDRLVVVGIEIVSVVSVKPRIVLNVAFTAPEDNAAEALRHVIDRCSPLLRNLGDNRRFGTRQHEGGLIRSLLVLIGFYRVGSQPDGTAGGGTDTHRCTNLCSGDGTGGSGKGAEQRADANADRCAKSGVGIFSCDFDVPEAVAMNDGRTVHGDVAAPIERPKSVEAFVGLRIVVEDDRDIVVHDMSAFFSA